MIIQRQPYPPQPPQRPVFPCPQCRQVAVIEYGVKKRNKTKDGLGVAAGVMLVLGVIGMFACVGVFLLPPAVILGIVAICLPSDIEEGSERFCQACGHRWRI